MESITHIKTHVALIAVSLIYGVSYSVIKTITPEFVAPFGFIVYRVFFAGIGMWILALGKIDTIDWHSDGFRLLACAFSGVAINQLLFFKGISMTTAVHGGLLMTLIPVFVFILSKIMLKEVLGSVRLIGLTIAFLGTLMIVFSSGADLTDGDRLGDMMLVANSFSFALYLILAKPLMAKYHALTVTKWVFLFAFVMVLPVGYQEAQEAQWSRMGFPEMIGLIYVILFGTLIVYLLNNWALKRAKSSTVGIYVYTQPVFATIVALFFYGELFTFIEGIATVFIFGGVYLVTSFVKSRR